MDQHHIDEKKPACAGDVEELKWALQVLRESPRFQIKLALGKLDYLLRSMDEGRMPDRETERHAVRNGIFAALTWLSEADASLFPEDQKSWLRTIATLHFDSIKTQCDSSDWALSSERVKSAGESVALAVKEDAIPRPAARQ